jgi:HPt (histidine-containing phosphotransfer) domain-containing protein
MIAWNRVHELRDEVGAEDFGEVVELFLEEVEEVITRLRDAPRVEQLEEDLHFLKGSALNLGFAEFSTLCQDGESRSARGEGASVDLPRILQSYEKSKASFLEGAKVELA